VALRQEEFTSLCDDVDLDRDRALVERCQAGDSAAFGNLYARYYERLLRFCLRRLNDRHESEDAAQEAFARAWKALPQFAGERRFYPWLTVIAGNICTDMLRRRSRSTPTDDFELSAHQPVGTGGSETSEELVLAAVDGELVNKALGRLSVRHRHVLAMREGSGWTYQQIADHEGVEIGTIETLLWRARQALKREFTVLSESKGMLVGFLAGTSALVRRGMLRAVNRGAAIPAGGGGGGGLRNAFAGVAVTSAAVAAVLITPHALSTSQPGSPVPPAAAGAAQLADPPLFTTTTSGPNATSTTLPGIGSSVLEAGGSGPGASSSADGRSSSTKGSGLSSTSKLGNQSTGLTNGLPTSSSLGPLAPVAGGVTSSVNSLLGSVLGIEQALAQLGKPASTTTSTTAPSLAGVVNGTVKAVVGGHS
jgi:RNA polymerase sigma-70 factor (ECF subfamily)